MCVSVGEDWVLGGSCLAERLSHYVRLSDAERESLDRLEEQDRSYRRGAVVIRENEAPRELFIVRSGWLHSSVVLGNGSRQIMRFHFQGDIFGLPLLAFADSPETVTAVTDVTLCPFSRERLAGADRRSSAARRPLLGLAVAERVSLADRLASIGRTSARARVGSLLCEIFARMRLLGAADDDGDPAAADPGGYRRRHRPHRGPRQPDDARPGRGRDHRAHRQPGPPARRGAAVSPRPISSTAPASRPAGSPRRARRPVPGEVGAQSLSERSRGLPAFAGVTSDHAFSSVHCSGCWFWRAKSITWATLVSATS